MPSPRKLAHAVVIVRSDGPPRLPNLDAVESGVIFQGGDSSVVESGAARYWLCLVLRHSAVDPAEPLSPMPFELPGPTYDSIGSALSETGSAETPSPIGQETPVEWFGQ